MDAPWHTHTHILHPRVPHLIIRKLFVFCICMEHITKHYGENKLFPLFTWEPWWNPLKDPTSTTTGLILRISLQNVGYICTGVHTHKYRQILFGSPRQYLLAENKSWCQSNSMAVFFLVVGFSQKQCSLTVNHVMISSADRVILWTHDDDLFCNLSWQKGNKGEMSGIF